MPPDTAHSGNSDCEKYCLILSKKSGALQFLSAKAIFTELELLLSVLAFHHIDF